MRKFHPILLALPAILAASTAFAVGTQAPMPLTNPGGPRASYNGYTDQEINTAVTHADQAAAAKDITGVQEHLRHVINCLTGPTGAGFDASVDDPCMRMGNGALNDVPQDSDEHRLLTQAFNEARNGLTVHDVASARSISKQVLNDLENAKNDVQQ